MEWLHALFRAPVVGKPCRIFWRSLCIYSDTDGEQRAASFAYYAFFALFPLILLFVSIASMFVDRMQASTAIINFVDRYIPVGPGEENIVTQTINGIVKNRGGAGMIAVL